MANIDKIVGRPQEYLAETGVPQLAGGLIWLFLGGSVLIQRLLPKEFGAQQLSVWIAIACAGAALLGARALKQRIVFPRGGYVQPRSRPAARSTFVACIAAVVALGIFTIVWRGQVPRLENRFVAPGFALAFAIICVASAWKQRSSPILLFGVYLACLAPILGRMPLSSYEGMSCLEVGVGVPLAAAGAIRLRNFMRANPRPIGSANE